MNNVFKYIDENSEQYIDWLIEACDQPSVSAQNDGMIEMKELVKKFLGKIGAEVEEVETGGYPIIYGEINIGKEKTLTFYNHYDVQPVDPIDEWLTEPFKSTIKDGQLFARGVADNKGNLISRICAVDAYQKIYGELPVNVKFIFEGEEEVGSPHLGHFKENFPEKVATDGIIWEGGTREVIDKRPHVSLGIKGICYLELVCKGANFDLHSSEAAIIENPAWRLMWALNTIKNEKEEILIDGFYDDVTPLSDKARDFIKTISYNEEATKKAYGIDGFLNNVTGDSLKERLIAAPTSTVCGFVSGYIDEGSKTVLPSVAKVKLDFRLVPNQRPDKIAKLLRKHLDKHGFQDIEIQRNRDGNVPFNTDPDHPFVDVVLKSIDEVYDEPPIIYRNLAGSSPMYKLLDQTNIPAVQIGVANTQSKAHSPNENIYIDDYIQGIKAIASVMNNMKLLK